MAHTLFFSLLFFSALSIAAIADDGVFMAKLLKAITPTPSGWSHGTLFCNWNGVKCDNTNRVTSISLNDNKRLTETLPSDFNSLSQLTTLDLSFNAFIGPLPSFANLILLNSVDAESNNFTFIPDGCFKGLTNLQDVILSYNVNLAPWTFPTYLAPLTNLSKLDLQATNMEGTLPNIFNSFHSLTYLDLSYNNITGVLPDSLPQSPIEYLLLNNQTVGLSGSIGVLSEMIHLSVVWLDHNMFTGPIPDLSNCTSLFDLRLRDNFLRGEVSLSLAGLSKLSNLFIENNMLRGPLPPLRNDVRFTFNPINRMCPNSSDGLCDQMVLLDVVEAFENPLHLINSWKWNSPCQNWSFIACEEGNVTAVKLAKQGLKGTISPEFAKLVNLVSLDLSGNTLSGSIPKSLETLPQLETLDVSYNNLSGMVPEFRPSVKLNAVGNVMLQSSKGNGPSSRASPSTIAIASGSFTGTLAFVSAIVIICYRKRCLGLIQKRIFKKTSLDHNAEEFIKRYGSLVPKHYSYSEVKRLTKLFKHKLGQGGFGIVYKATLPDGRLAAIKVISESKGSGEEFINEVVSISKTSHVNIVTLLGFCYEMNKRALIYEFMPNGSLDKFVYKKGSPSTNCDLDWKILYRITIGIAQGLAYLHRGCGTRILHLDIKPQNILLDEDFCPKISDFGLAKTCKKKESIVSMLGTRGTIGYIAPEMLSRTHGGVWHKSDVYSYGMLVLEMVGVRKSRGSKESHTTEVYFPDWIYKDLEQDNIHSICEHITEEENDMVRKMIIVSLWCIQTNPIDRPSMSKVVEMLEGPLQSMPFPPKPSFSNEAPLQLLEISSNNLYETNSITIREDVLLSQMSSRRQKSSQGQEQSPGKILQQVQGIDEESSQALDFMQCESRIVNLL